MRSSNGAAAIRPTAATATFTTRSSRSRPDRRSGRPAAYARTRIIAGVTMGVTSSVDGTVRSGTKVHRCRAVVEILTPWGFGLSWGFVPFGPTETRASLQVPFTHGARVGSSGYLLAPQSIGIHRTRHGPGRAGHDLWSCDDGVSYGRYTPKSAATKRTSVKCGGDEAVTLSKVAARRRTGSRARSRSRDAGRTPSRGAASAQWRARFRCWRSTGRLPSDQSGA